MLDPLTTLPFIMQRNPRDLRPVFRVSPVQGFFTSMDAAF